VGLRDYISTLTDRCLALFQVHILSYAIAYPHSAILFKAESLVAISTGHRPVLVTNHANLALKGRKLKPFQG